MTFNAPFPPTYLGLWAEEKCCLQQSDLHYIPPAAIFFRLFGDAFNLISPIHYFSLVSSLFFFYFSKGTSSSYYVLPAGEFMRDHVFFRENGGVGGGGSAVYNKIKIEYTTEN